MLPSPKPNKLHLPPLDGLRAICALWVLLYHFHPITSGIFTPLIFAEYGNYAVQIFLVISGFCLAIPIAQRGEIRGGAWTFYQRRARRILPPYYFSIIFVLFLEGFHINRSGLITHLLLIQNLSPRNFFSINPSLWSIALECQIYLLFPWFVLTAQRIGIHVACLSAGAIGIGLHLLLNKTVLWGSYTQYWLFFTMGFFAAFVTVSEHPKFVAYRSRPIWGRLSVLCVIGFFVSQSIWHNPQWKLIHMIPNRTHPYLLYGLWISLAAACLLIHVTTRPDSHITRWLSWPPLAFCGTFSYSIYLLHQPLVDKFRYFVERYGHGHERPLQVVFLLGVVPLIILVSYLFHLIFERPFMSIPQPKSAQQAEQASITSPAP
jgi:peptidoglycan/LPS O-acetylase OafA/YrhL